MKISSYVVTIALLVANATGHANPTPNPNCSFLDAKSLGKLKTDDAKKLLAGLLGASGGFTTNMGGARIVARLVDAPRTRVTLSIDNKAGDHFEMTWDPAINDGLQHSVVVPYVADAVWRLSPSVEDDRVQSGQVVIALSTRFDNPTVPANGSDLTFVGQTDAIVANAATKGLTTQAKVLTDRPRIVVSCEPAKVDIAALPLDTRKLVAAQNARSLLDQSVPAPVEEAFSLLAEIAVDRAEAGAMDLVKRKFVDPMCSHLTLQLFSLGDPARADKAFPKACALLEQLRLDDVLSSGKSLVDAVKDDVRETIAPALLSKLPLSDQTRALARLALDFTNRLVDGQATSALALDRLIAEIERIPWSAGFELDIDLVLGWLEKLDGVTPADFEVKLLTEVLPIDLNDIPNPPWKVVKSCWRDYGGHETTPPGNLFPVGKYHPADRQRCIQDLRLFIDTPNPNETGAHVSLSLAAWIKRALDLAIINVSDVARTGQAYATKSLSEWVYEQYKEKGADLAKKLRQSRGARAAITAACTARLVVGALKWCAGRESCSAGDVASVLDHPENYFSRVKELPESLCWNTDETWAYPVDKRALDLGMQLVSFLQPVQKGEEKERAIAMVRWLFSVSAMLNERVSADRDLQDAMSHIESILLQLIDRDYLRALSEGFAVARRLCAAKTSRCDGSVAADKALQLVGAIASYVQTYEETKTMSPTDARAARKKALESLIDSATNRHDRRGQSVASIGIPVGFSGGLLWRPGDNNHYTSRLATFDAQLGYQLRVPLAFAWQRLPGHWRDGLGALVPTHFAFWIADLGQFTRSSQSGADNSVSWNDFVGFGVQLGYLVGEPDHGVVIAPEFSWAPGLYGRDETIQSGSTTSVVHVQGAFTLGLTLAYYVPLFDFN